MSDAAERNWRSATDETPLVRGLLILAAVAGMALLVAAPLLAVFVEALAKGWFAALKSLGNPDALSAIRLTLIVAETISAQSGIGYMTMNAREFLQTDVVLVGILLYALLGKLADVLAVALERFLLRWHAGYQK